MRFFPNDNITYPNYLEIGPPPVGQNKCKATVGYHGVPKQLVMLYFTDDKGSWSCGNTHGTIIHELLHSLGKYDIKIY